MICLQKNVKIKSFFSPRMPVRKRRNQPKRVIRKKRSRRPSRPVRSARAPVLTGCAKDYLEVQYRPFNPKISKAPCLPDTKAFPSHKFFLKRRWSVATGTGGTAYVLFNPYTIDSSSSTNYCAVYTGTTYAGTNFNPNTATTGVWGTLWDGSYDGTFGQDNKHRVVAAGIRLAYAGEAQLCKGLVQVWKHPTNKKTYFSTSQDVNTINEFDDTAFIPLQNGKVYECVYHPSSSEDYNYDVSKQDAYIMGIMVTGAPNQQSFVAEVIAWYEGIGEDFDGYSPSDSNVQSMGIINSLPRMQIPGVVKDAAMNAMNRFVAAATRHTATAMGRYALNAVAGQGVQYLIGN